MSNTDIQQPATDIVSTAKQTDIQTCQSSPVEEVCKEANAESTHDLEAALAALLLPVKPPGREAQAQVADLQGASMQSCIRED